MISSYTYELAYNTYLAEQASNQLSIMHYMESCILNEAEKGTGVGGVIDSVRGLIKKLINAIKRMWAKFIERTSELFNTTKSFLKKYESIILKKPPLSRDITLDQYNIDKLDSIKVPDFNYETLKEILASNDSKEEIQKKILDTASDKSIIPDFKSNQSISDKIEEIVVEPDKQINGTDLNLKARYYFCMNFDKRTDDIKRDFENLDKTERELLKLVDEYKKKQEDNKKEQNNQPPQPQQDQNDTNNQETIKSVGSSSGNSGGTSNNTTQTHDHSNTIIRGYGVHGRLTSLSESPTIGPAKTDAETTKAREIDNGVKPLDKNSIKDNMEKNVDTENFGNLEKNISIYFTICGDILGAKLHFYEAHYKDSVKLLKMHIRDYVKDVEDPDTKPNADR